MAILGNTTKKFRGAAMAAAVTLGSMATPFAASAQGNNLEMAANNTKQPTEIALQSPSTRYENGQRVAQSEVKDALEYYDAVIYYGDDIYPSSAYANASGLTENGVKTLALSGWSASKCAIVLTKNTTPGVQSTFTQDDMDRGWLREYAEDIVKTGEANSLGECLRVHPPTTS